MASDPAAARRFREDASRDNDALPRLVRFLYNPGAWRKLYENALERSARQELAQFEKSSLPDEEKNAIRDRVEEAVWLIDGYEARIVFANKGRDLALFLCLVAAFLLALSGPAVLGEDRLSVWIGTVALSLLALIGTLGLVYVLSALLEERTPYGLSVLLLGICGLYIFLAVMVVDGDGWLSRAAELAFAVGAIASAGFAMAVALPPAARGFIWRIKLRRQPEEEIIQSLNLLLSCAEASEREPSSRDTRARIIEQMEWIAEVVANHLPKALGAGDRATDAWIQERVERMARGLRNLKREVLFPAPEGEPELLSKLRRCLVAAATGQWAAFAADEESTIVPHKRQISFAPVVAVAPLAIVAVLSLAPVDLSEKAAGFVNAAFLPAGGLFVAYVMTWLDPKSGSAVEQAGKVLDFWRSKT